MSIRWLQMIFSYFSVVFANQVHASLQIFLDVTLPEPQDEPAHIGQFVIDFLISLDILF